DILFGSAKDFQWNNIPMQFWWFVVISLCLFALIFTIQMIVLIFKEVIETKTKFVLAIQNAIKAFSFIFLIPIFFFLANFIIKSLANTVINNFGNGSNIAQYLYHIGDPSWDGKPINKPGFPVPGNIGNYNMIAQLFGTWFMLYAVFMIRIILVQKIVELFFLFIISPIVMIVMVVDDGKAAFTWKDMVGAKFLDSTGTLIGYYIFISVTQILLSSNLSSLEDVDWAKPLFIILFLCGEALATMAFSDIVANFLGESAGIREGRASLKSTLAGGMMAMGAGQMTGRALGFMKSKHAQKQAGITNNSNPLHSEGYSTGSGINNTTFRNAANGMASRSGIIGLAGLGAGALGIGIGHMSAGAKKSWKSGSRQGFWGKTRGIARVVGKAVTAPIVSTTKVLGSGLKNTYQVGKESGLVTSAEKLKKHQKYLTKKNEKYPDKAEAKREIIKKTTAPKEINKLEKK
ncbi:MAG: Mbov_0396 family ICE element transmembrane protein, partial [Spiroplasma sp.]